MFEALLDTLITTFLGAGQNGLKVGKAEQVATFERLACFAFTGDPRVCPISIWNAVGITDGINQRGWPFIDPKVFDIRSGHIDFRHWPLHPTTSLPKLAHIKPLEHYYGKEAAQTHLYWLYTEHWAVFRGENDVYTAIEKVVKQIYIPEMRRWVLEGLRRSSVELFNEASHSISSSRDPESEGARQRSERKERNALLKQFENSLTPFQRGFVQTLQIYNIFTSAKANTVIDRILRL